MRRMLAIVPFLTLALASAAGAQTYDADQTPPPSDNAAVDVLNTNVSNAPASPGEDARALPETVVLGTSLPRPESDASGLALTGSDIAGLVGTGAGAIALGVVVTRTTRRRAA